MAIESRESSRNFRQLKTAKWFAMERCPSKTPCRISAIPGNRFSRTSHSSFFLTSRRLPSGAVLKAFQPTSADKSRNIIRILLTFLQKLSIFTQKQAIYFLFYGHRQANRRTTKVPGHFAGGPGGYVGGQPANRKRHRERQCKPELRGAFQNSLVPWPGHFPAGAHHP